jgi:vacuolar protein sorting-associated protein 45
VYTTTTLIHLLSHCNGTLLLHRYANFGDLGAAVKGLMDEYQRATKLNENIQSIEDMQAFLERFPAFKSQSLNVSY